MLTIYIRDQVTDIQAGKNAEIFTGWAVWGFSKGYEDKLKRIDPDYVFMKPKEVLSLLKIEEVFLVDPP